MTDNQLSRATIQGPSAKTFLQGYVTCELNDLTASFAIPMAVTELKGRVLANGWVHGDEESVSLWMHTSVTEDIQRHLLPYLRFARCEMLVDSEAWSVSANLDLATVQIKMNDKRYGLTKDTADTEDLHEFQLSTGYPLVTQATSGKFLPQMLNLTAFDVVSFTKGCYLGQEVVARAEHRGQVKRRLYRIEHDSMALNAGQTVQTEQGDKAIVAASTESSSLVVLSTSVPKDGLKLAEVVPQPLE